MLTATEIGIWVCVFAAFGVNCFGKFITALVFLAIACFLLKCHDAKR